MYRNGEAGAYGRCLDGNGTVGRGVLWVDADRRERRVAVGRVAKWCSAEGFGSRDVAVVGAARNWDGTGKEHHGSNEMDRDRGRTKSRYCARHGRFALERNATERSGRAILQIARWAGQTSCLSRGTANTPNKLASLNAQRGKR